ncbi:MAG: hypothetical protein F4Y94_09245 [Chloroflexi bacterium]|nr:hypothetical protein [Chloroflexota bacterium]
MRRPAILRRAWKRLRPDRIDVELDVVEQLILGHLLRFETGLQQDLRDTVLISRRTANEVQVRLSLIRLESLRLIEREPDDPEQIDGGVRPGAGGRRYRITRDGKRLRRVIPLEPGASIQTHV